MTELFLILKDAGKGHTASSLYKCQQLDLGQEDVIEQTIH